MWKKQSRRATSRSTEQGVRAWELWGVSLLGYLLPKRQREEWMGDLTEARFELLEQGWRRWALVIVTLGRAFLLAWSLIRIKYQDLGLAKDQAVDLGLKTKGLSKIVEYIQKLAVTNTSVLVTGESGTGKEWVARAIHRNGLRKDQPFVAMNCGAIPEHLVESEL